MWGFSYPHHTIDHYPSDSKTIKGSHYVANSNVKIFFYKQVVPTAPDSYIQWFGCILRDWNVISLYGNWCFEPLKKSYQIHYNSYITTCPLYSIFIFSIETQCSCSEFAGMPFIVVLVKVVEPNTTGDAGCQPHKTKIKSFLLS